jgi:hypothetical protein
VSLRESLVTCRNLLDGIRTGVGIRSWDKSGGCSAFWPDGARHIGDTSPVCCVRVEQEKADLDTIRRVCRVRGSVPSVNSVEGLSTDARFAGGPVRSSDEARVMRVERRGWVVRDCVRSINQADGLGGVVGAR